MGLHQMKCALRAEVRAERNQKRFEEAKKHQLEMREHETVLSVLAVLGDESALRYAEKEALTRALLREHKRRPHPFWNAVLVVAFYPMLARLRGRIFGDAVPGDDLDQIVLSSFFEVVRDFPLSQRRDRTCMYLRQMTQREVFKRVRAEQRDLEQVRFDDPEDISRRQDDLESLGHLSSWPETKPNKPRRRDAKESAALVSFLVEHAGHILDGDKLELVVATLVRGELLTSYVDRVHPELSPSERRRTYQRIKRRHSRAIARLREVLADLRVDFECPQTACPRPDPTQALTSRDSASPPRGGTTRARKGGQKP